MKFHSDKSFFEFLGTKKGSPIWLLLIFAAILLLLPAAGQRSDAPADDLESRTAELCSSVLGAGECRVMITYRDEEVYAVAVVCDGAESIEVRRDITELLSSLYGIGTNRVEILPLE